VAVAVTAGVAVVVTVGVPFLCFCFFLLAVTGVLVWVETGVVVTTVIVPVGVSLSVNRIVMVPVAVAVTAGERVPVGVSVTVPETVGVTLAVTVPTGVNIVVPFGVALPAFTELDVSVPGPKGVAGAEVPPQERLINKQGVSTSRAVTVNCNVGLFTVPLCRDFKSRCKISPVVRLQAEQQTWLYQRSIKCVGRVCQFQLYKKLAPLCRDYSYPSPLLILV
jgi:hypothetical protein